MLHGLPPPCPAPHGGLHAVHISVARDAEGCVIHGMPAFRLTRPGVVRDVGGHRGTDSCGARVGNAGSVERWRFMHRRRKEPHWAAARSGYSTQAIRLDGRTNAPWLANAIQTQQDKLVGLGIHLPLPAIMDVRAQVRPSTSEDPSDVPALRPAERSRRHCCGYLSALVICASCSVSAPRATYPAHSTSQLLPYSTGFPYATKTALCFLQLPLHWHPPERAAARAKGVSASRLAFGQRAPLSRDVMTRSPF